jgi:hypothetical protein
VSKFKKLSDVEVVAEPIESANVLIEEDGVIKKAPKTAVGGAGVVSWNDLADKPFGEELNTIYSFTGTVGVDSSETTELATIFTLSEYIYDYISPGKEYVVVLNGEKYRVLCIGGAVTMMGNGALFWDHVESDGIPFMFIDNYLYIDLSYSGKIEIEIKDITPVPIGEEFIPDAIARASNVPTSFTWDEILHKPFEEISNDKALFEGYLEAGSYGDPSVTLLNRPLEPGYKYLIFTDESDEYGREIVAEYELRGGQFVGCIRLGDLDNGIEIIGDKVYRRGGESLLNIYKVRQIREIDKKYLPKAEAVADATGTIPTAAEFNALLTALRNAGYLKT